jgi:hypothetical protein
VAPKLCFGCGLQALLQFAPADAAAGQDSRQNGSFGSVGSDHGDSSPASSSSYSSGSSSSSSSSGSNGSSHTRADNDTGSSPGAGSLLAPLLQGGSGGGWGSDAAALVDVYRDCGYVLTWQGGAGRAMLREGVPATTGLQVGAHQHAGFQPFGVDSRNSCAKQHHPASEVGPMHT